MWPLNTRLGRLWYRVWGIALWVLLAVIAVTRGGAWVLERLGW